LFLFPRILVGAAIVTYDIDFVEANFDVSLGFGVDFMFHVVLTYRFRRLSYIRFLDSMAFTSLNVS